MKQDQDADLQICRYWRHSKYVVHRRVNVLQDRIYQNIQQAARPEENIISKKTISHLQERVFQYGMWPLLTVSYDNDEASINLKKIGRTWQTKKM